MSINSNLSPLFPSFTGTVNYSNSLTHNQTASASSTSPAISPIASHSESNAGATFSLSNTIAGTIFSNASGSNISSNLTATIAPISNQDDSNASSSLTNTIAVATFDGSNSSDVPPPVGMPASQLTIPARLAIPTPTFSATTNGSALPISSASSNHNQ